MTLKCMHRSRRTCRDGKLEKAVGIYINILNQYRMTQHNQSIGLVKDILSL